MDNVTPEQLASKRVRLAASSLGIKLMRNNSGAFQDSTGRWVRYGLGNESKRVNDSIKFGDYIGYTPVVITPEMVGKTVAVFTNMEIKPELQVGDALRKAERDPDSREAAQFRAINLVRDAGGIAWFVGSEKHVHMVIDAFYQEIKR